MRSRLRKRGAKSVISMPSPLRVEQARAQHGRVRLVELLAAGEVFHARCSTGCRSRSASSKALKTGSPSKRGRQHQTIRPMLVDQGAEGAIADHAAIERTGGVDGAPCFEGVRWRAARGRLVGSSFMGYVLSNGWRGGRLRQYDAQGSATRCGTGPRWGRADLHAVPANTLYMCKTCLVGGVVADEHGPATGERRVGHEVGDAPCPCLTASGLTSTTILPCNQQETGAGVARPRALPAAHSACNSGAWR